MKLGRFVISGIVAGLIIAVINAIIFFGLDRTMGYKAEIIGQTPGALHFVIIAVIGLIACLIGSVIYYLLRKKRTRADTIYIVILVSAAVLNSVGSQTLLLPEYRGIAHLFHIVVPICSYVALVKMTK